MKLRHFVALLLILALGSVSAMAAAPEGGVLDSTKHSVNPTADKAASFVDLEASAQAAVDYVLKLQADITSDYAGNGASDTDPDDGGWDWHTSVFSHTASNSAGNLYGATANSLYQMYQVQPSTDLWDAMTDAADWMADPLHAANTAYDIDSGPDIDFLLNYAVLSGVSTPATYQNAAKAIWDSRKAENGGTAGFAAMLFGWANGAGQPGIAAWDAAAYCQNLMKLDTLYFGMGYGTDAVDLANILWDDSIGTPNNFQVYNTGVVTGGYTLGASGLIRAFVTTGTHLAEIPALQNVLLASQYASGGFNHEYGTAVPGQEEYQATAYALWAMHDNLDMTSASVATAFANGVEWLTSVQDVSGGFLEIDLSHYPEIGAECATALIYGMTATAASVGATADGPDPAACGLTKTVTFDYNRNDLTPGLRGYEITVEVVGPVTVTDANFATSGTLETIGGGSGAFFDVVDLGSNTFVVNGSILGATAGLLADGDLFTMDLTTASDGTVFVNILSYKLRDPDNVSIYADMTGTSFVVDCTAPNAVTGITAAPGHNKVDVAWSHDGLDVDHYVAFSGLWYNVTPGVSAYPEYDDLAGDVIPAAPTDYVDAAGSAEWVALTNVTAPTLNLTQAWGNHTDRGVYYYTVFAVDAAGNVSAAPVGLDRATNYWLGDIATTGGVPTPDGDVGIPDINALATAFGTSHGDGAYDNVIDVGPTDDWGRLGIPTTDNNVDFEDLMVFSMNFSVVSATKDRAPVSKVVDLAWITNDDGSMALRLVNGSSLKGLRIQANLPVNSVTAGQLLDDQSDLTFLKNVGTRLDASVAIMGVNNGFNGTGDLMIIAAGSPITAEDLTITARGTDNSKLTVNLDKASGSVTPRVFELYANYPNPFNPMTKISFSLPEAQMVELVIYSLDGRKVATLMSGTQSAGLHEVVWMGRDDAGRATASGTYFYRINAGPYSQVHKMTLMK